MALAVCLLLDPETDATLRRLWARLEQVGVGTLLTHTHRHHVPHVSYAVLREYDVGAVREAVAALPPGGPVPLHFDAIGLFRRGRACLVPAVTADVMARHAGVVDAVLATGADLHRHYAPGRWVPHCSLATRSRTADLPALASVVHDVLPVDAVADHAALVDSATGERWPLTGVP